ncbi:hypothetical protein PVAP13_1KG252154 [Panicum virgatum]|uniref:Uncharacterized protein n=1 Tax=Panicum virgatum TaxID=38727 RepID=A0A8T0X6R5_PANVG|nr:hypothetical protein PVAP13_1KG252154 [Panicum virgatum]
MPPSSPQRGRRRHQRHREPVVPAPCCQRPRLRTPPVRPRLRVLDIAVGFVFDHRWSSPLRERTKVREGAS